MFVPAHVDATGYRRYSRDQLDTARPIARLRSVHMPLAGIQGCLQADPGTVRAALLRHERLFEVRQIRVRRTCTGSPTCSPTGHRHDDRARAARRRLHAARRARLAPPIGLGDRDLAFCYEALAVPIADAEDRDLLLENLESIPGLDRFW